MRSRLAAAFALAVAPLAACGGASDAEQTLKTAEATLAALHSTPGAAPDEFVVETHDRIRRDLASVLSGDAESPRAAAQLIVGQTHAGDAELAAREAERLESQASDLLAQAETLAARLYLWRHTRAEAAGNFRPDDVLAEIADQIAEAQAERRERLDEQERLQQRLDELEAAAQSAADEARGHRAEEVRLRDQALTQDAQDRAGTIERVFEAQRAADDAVARQADIRARIDQLRPQLREIEQEVAGAERQIELLRDSLQSPEDRPAPNARTPPGPPPVPRGPPGPNRPHRPGRPRAGRPRRRRPREPAERARFVPPGPARRRLRPRRVELRRGRVEPPLRLHRGRECDLPRRRPARKRPARRRARRRRRSLRRPTPGHRRHPAPTALRGRARVPRQGRPRARGRPARRRARRLLERRLDLPPSRPRPRGRAPPQPRRPARGPRRGPRLDSGGRPSPRGTGPRARVGRELISPARRSPTAAPILPIP